MKENLVRMASVGKEELKVIDGVCEAFSLINSNRTNKHQKKSLVKLIKNSLQEVVLADQEANNELMLIQASALLVKFPNKQDRVIVDNAIAIIEDLEEKNPKLSRNIVKDLSGVIGKINKSKEYMDRNDLYAVGKSVETMSKIISKNIELGDLNGGILLEPLKDIKPDLTNGACTIRGTELRKLLPTAEGKKKALIKSFSKVLKKARAKKEKQDLAAEMGATTEKLKSGVYGMQKNYQR